MAPVLKVSRSPIIRARSRRNPANYTAGLIATVDASPDVSWRSRGHTVIPGCDLLLVWADVVDRKPICRQTVQSRIDPPSGNHTSPTSSCAPAVAEEWLELASGPWRIRHSQGPMPPQSRRYGVKSQSVDTLSEPHANGRYELFR